MNRTQNQDMLAAMPSAQAADRQRAVTANRGALSALLERADTLTDRVLFGTLLLALVASPFEIGYPPLGRVLFATFTNLEVVLLALVAILALRLAASPAARARLLRLPLLLPMLALLGACALSAVFGEFRSLGEQFIYRLLVGMTVFAAVRESLRSPGRLLAALCTFVGAAAVSATLGLLEFAPWIDIQPLLKPFKPQPTTVGGLLRLSGSFEYANGAAIYFEMALPVVIGLAVFFSSSRMRAAVPALQGLSTRFQRGLMLALYAAIGLLGMALILTFSRASWLGAMFSVAVIGAAGFVVSRKLATKGLWRSIRVPVVAAVGVLGLAAFYTCLTQPLLLLRLTGENDSTWYNYSLMQSATIRTIAASDTVTVPLVLTNNGPMEWNAERVPTVHVSYHWRQQGNGFYSVFDGLRTALPHNVAPGESIVVDAYLQAPPKTGSYILEWDLVQENVSWFYEKNKIAPASALVTVDTATTAHTNVIDAGHPPVSVQQVENSDTSTVARTQLWRVAFAMFKAHPIFGVGPDGFRNLYGKYSGKSAWNPNIYTNNTYIEMFTDLGILGGAAFLWLLGLALWRTVRSVFLLPAALRGIAESAPGLWALGLGASTALFCFVVHGLVDYFLFSTPLYTIFWFILGVSVTWPLIAKKSSEDAQNVNSETAAPSGSTRGITARAN